MVPTNGTTTSSNPQPPPPPPALTYNGTKQITLESKTKPTTASVPAPLPHPPPPPPVILPLPRVQNERLTDTESKAKTNGHHQVKEMVRLNDKPTAIIHPTNKTETLKSTQASRWTSNPNKQIAVISSKHPPPRTIVY